MADLYPSPVQDQIEATVHLPETEPALGSSYRMGFARSRGRYLTFFPADGQFPASIIGQFLPFMQVHDLVLGYIHRAALHYLELQAAARAEGADVEVRDAGLAGLGHAIVEES